MPPIAAIVAFPMLYIVIVNWNLKDDTLACIDSLITAGASPEQIVLIDNGSSDGSVAALKSRFGNSLHITRNSENLGYAVGTNQGIRKAMEKNAEWILLLNNDTLVAPDFFEQMAGAMQATGLEAILAPLIFYYDEPERVWYLGDRLIPGTLITTNPYRGMTSSDEFPEKVSVDFVSGSAMFIRRDVFEKIGYLDASLVMYGEEIDFCWRARLVGYRLVCVTQARMWHKVSISAKRIMPQTRYFRIRNQIIFYRRYARGLQRPLMFLFSLLVSFSILLKDILQRQPDLISPLLRGWKDGWKNRYKDHGQIII